MVWFYSDKLIPFSNALDIALPLSQLAAIDQTSQRTKPSAIGCPNVIASDLCTATEKLIVVAWDS
jgi:hypothetical protein